MANTTTKELSIRFSYRGVFFALLVVFLLHGCTPTNPNRQTNVRDFNADGIYLYQKGDFVRAKETFEFALKQKPEDPNLLYNLAQCHDQLGENQKAEEVYRLCLQKDPNHPSAQHSLARLLMLEGRRGEATKTIETWLASQPKSAEAYVQDAWRWQQDGDLLKAQGRLQQALELDPRNVRALVNLGVLYELMERPDRALALYEKALREQPDRTDLRERVNQLVAKGVNRPLPDS